MATTTEFIVKVPWPSRTLSPNARSHWTVKAHAVSIARSMACKMARNTLAKAKIKVNPESVTRIRIRYLFAPPDRRPRDEDNLSASMKPTADGIADAMKVNDKNFHYEEVFFLKPTRPAYVLANITVELKDEGTQTQPTA